MSVELKSRIPEIVVEADKNAKANIQRTVLEIEAGAKRNLVEHGSIVTTNLISSVEHDFGGFDGDVGTAVAYAPFVEYGTGRRGAASEFRGKPDDLTYSLDGRWETRTFHVGGEAEQIRFFNSNWKGAAAKPFLIPAAEAARVAYERRAAETYG